MAVHVPPRIYRRVPFKTAVRLQFDRFRGFIEEYSANLSLGGMFIRTDSPPPVGTELPIEFRLGNDYELIRGVGRVVWVREEALDADNPAGIGIRFLDLTPGSRELIFKMVERRVRDGGVPFDLDAAAELLPGRPPDPGPAPEGTVPEQTVPEETEPALRGPQPGPAGDGGGEQRQRDEHRGMVAAAAAAEYARETTASRPAEPPPAAAVRPEPAPTDSAPTEPELTEPEVPEPEPFEPVLPESVLPEPVLPESVLAEPALAEPAPLDPTLAEPAVADAPALESSPAEAALALGDGNPPVPSEPVAVEAPAAGDEPPQVTWSAAEAESFSAPPAPPPWEQSEGREWTAAGERREGGAAFSSDDGAPRTPSWRRVAVIALPAVLALAVAAYLVQDRFLADEPLDLGPTADWTAALKKDETAPLPVAAEGAGETGAAEGGDGGTPSAGGAAPAEEPAPAGPAPDRGSAATTAAGGEPARHIEDITWSSHPGGTTFLVWTDGALVPGSWVDFRIGGANPRHVVRILGIERPFASGAVEVDGPQVRQVRTGLHSDRRPSELHLVFDLASQDVEVRSIEAVGSRLRIEVAAARSAEGGG